MKKRVLIIDDEADLVAMLSLRLKATGLFDVAVAHDGSEGLARAAEFKPDVVLLDNVMPGMDGWEVCRRLRESSDSRDAAVVMMTAGSPQKAREKAQELRLEGLLFKPYDPAQVVETLKSLSRGSPKENTC
jgi:CheY-like chemotaxis protein